MSHVVKMGEIEVNDLEALAVAARIRGLEFVQNVNQHRYYQGQYSPCSHIIRLPNAKEGTYEVGVVKNDQGGYNLAHDFWQSSSTDNDKLNAALGKNCRDLISTYIEQTVQKAHPTAQVTGEWVGDKYNVYATLAGTQVGGSNEPNYGFVDKTDF